MSFKKIKPVLTIVIISAITSSICWALFVFCFPASPVTPQKKSSQDAKFTTYENIINIFLGDLRKGQVEAAYKGTSPVFQKMTTLENFKKLSDTFQSNQNIPTTPCALTEYSEPFSGSITGLPDTYNIVQTKCESVEENEIKGFTVEFIDDEGKPKISYINTYKGPVVHKKEIK